MKFKSHQAICRATANSQSKICVYSCVIVGRCDLVHPVTRFGRARGRNCGNVSQIFVPQGRFREPVVDYSRNGGCLRWQETTTRRCVELEFEPEALDQPLTSIATSTSTFHRGVQPRGRRSNPPDSADVSLRLFSLNPTILSLLVARRSR